MALKTKPIERFPLKPRLDGRFQKRINGKLFYFGNDGDRDGALLEYDRVKHALYTGRIPRSVVEPETVTLKQVANLFTDEQEARCKSGDISGGHLGDYRNAIKRLLRFFGGGRIVSDLGPEDFAHYARHLRGKAGLGPYAYNRERACVLSMFNHAADCGWIENAVRVGRGFLKVSTSELREIRKRRLISGADIRGLLDKATPVLRAAILLGINGGLGATDIATLRVSDIDLDKGQLLAIRRKRKTLRAVPLWPETVKAIDVIVVPMNDLVFGRNGRKAESAQVTWVIKQFSELLDGPKGVAFGVLRHTFATIANEARDPDAVKRIMGHRLPVLSDVYVEDIDWKRLKRVTDHVRRAIGFQGSGRSPRSS